MLSMAAGGWLPFALGDDLPPPPSAVSMPDTTLYLEPVVNGRQTGNVVPVNYRGGHYYYDAPATARRRAAGSG